MFLFSFCCFYVNPFIRSSRNNDNLHYSIHSLNLVNNPDTQLPKLYLHEICEICPPFITQRLSISTFFGR